jgi:aspartate 4-decarboxylase
MNQDQLQTGDNSYKKLSPFEFMDKLISLAEGKKKSTRTLLNAGRGNPNWIAATPREAFFLLGQFAMEECRRVWNERDLAGQPERAGIADRFDIFIKKNASQPGLKLLEAIIDYGVSVHGFIAENLIYELVDGITGDNYPMPERSLVHIEKLSHDFLVKEMCSNTTGCDKYQLFMVEGATAAMCYIFTSLRENFLLSPEDKIAIMVPTFPPYLEIPRLTSFDFEVIKIEANELDAKGRHTWQYPDEELDKLADPAIKALFLVNPSNPPSVAIKPQSVRRLIEIVKKHNPDLMIISDDVYGTFVENYRSLMSELPYNTIGVYSLSKYFGATGWRLGVIAIHQNNVFDKLLEQLPPDKANTLQKRYSIMTRQPESLCFIDRVVADSRQVALNHTAGLSTPQQVQLALFAGFALLDSKDDYKNLTRDICHRRIKLLYEGLGLPQPNIPYDADYYTQFDMEEWSTRNYGREFTDYLQQNYGPLDVLFRLAEHSSIVLLNGEGFGGPAWSIRVSLANLNDEAYAKIGDELRKVLTEYVTQWQKFKAGHSL